MSLYHFIDYSYLSDLTGFRLATFHVCELTVSNATSMASKGPETKAQTGTGVWKKNLPRNILPIINANGTAIKTDIKSHLQ